MYRAVSKDEFDQNVDIKIESLDRGLEDYYPAILDIREDSMSEDEYEQISQDHIIDYNLEYEDRFLAFIKRVYLENRNSKTYVDCFTEKASSAGLITIMEYLDYKDRVVFLDLLRKGLDNTTYLELNEDIIETMIKLSTRELSFTTMYFTDRDITIWGNYNMSFLVFFKDESDKKHYSDIAREYGLYIREY